MSKIIIHNVDVSKCPYFEKEKGGYICTIVSPLCYCNNKNLSDCNYKYNKRKRKRGQYTTLNYKIDFIKSCIGEECGDYCIDTACNYLDDIVKKLKDKYKTKK